MQGSPIVVQMLEDADAEQHVNTRIGDPSQLLLERANERSDVRYVEKVIGECHVEECDVRRVARQLTAERGVESTPDIGNAFTVQ